MSRSARTEDSFATLTHARLRARQGDLSGARAILRELLARDAPDPRARRLLEQLGGRSREPLRRLAALQDLLRRVTRNMEATG